MQGEEDIFVARYDAEGNFVWVNQIGATGFDVGLGVAVDDANNAYVVGRFSMTVDFDPGSGTASLTAINTGSTGQRVVFWPSTMPRATMFGQNRLAAMARVV